MQDRLRDLITYFLRLHLSNAFAKDSFCVWVAGAVKSRLPRCVPPFLVAMPLAIRLGWQVGRETVYTGYEPNRTLLERLRGGVIGM